MTNHYEKNIILRQRMAVDAIYGEGIDDNVLIVVCHIPKACGTTLNAHLAGVYGNSMIQYHPDYNPEILESDIDHKKIRCISSHMPYGIHEKFSNSSKECGASLFSGRDIKYISVVRNPLDRMISYYNFVTTFPAHPYYSKTKDMDVATFFSWIADHKNDELSNLQCSLLSGRIGAGLEEAISSVEKNFYLVAPLEKFDVMISILSKELNWPDVGAPVRLNDSPKRVARADLDNKTLEIINSSNMDDFKLYNWVKDRFVDRAR